MFPKLKGADFEWDEGYTAEIDLKSHVKTVLTGSIEALNFRWGTLPPSPYEITWMAHLRDPITKKPSRPRWILWLLRNQNSDGSWGYHTESFRPRFLTTFQAHHVLSRLVKDFPWKKKRFQKSLNRAREWLLAHQHDLAVDWQDPAGYELILSSQISRAESDLRLELDFSDPHLKDVKLWRDQKITSLCDAKVLRVMPILHSAEGLEDVMAFKALERFLRPNGSLANSISASAWLVNHHSMLSAGSRRKLLEYLAWCTREHSHPVKAFPIEITEMAWAFGYLMMVMSPRELLSATKATFFRLHATCNMSPWLGFSDSYDVPDLDDTLMVHLILRRCGMLTPTSYLNNVLSMYQAQDHWRTYALERGVSLATQIRALWAAPHLNNVELQDVALRYLIHHRWKEFEAWSDKYIPSPWYSLAHLTCALHDHPDELLWPEMIDKIVDWLQTKQHPNGSYGIFTELATRKGQTKKGEKGTNRTRIGSVEETALALICAGLIKRRWKIEVDDPMIIRRAVSYMLSQLLHSSTNWPSITWMAKAGLYVLRNVFLATIITALRLVQQEHPEVLMK